MEAGLPPGAMSSGIQLADPATWLYGVAYRNGCAHRLVGSPGFLVLDHHHAAAGELACEADCAGGGRIHRIASRTGQVNAPVPGAPALVRRVEAAGDVGLTR